MEVNSITSKENKKIKHLKKLLADRDYRYLSKEYAVEGPHWLDDAEKIKEIFVLKGTDVPEIGADKTYIVDEKVFKCISETENSQGIIAVFPLNLQGASEIRKNSRYVFLDRLQDPGNMGTIIRTACAFDIKGLIVNQGCVDPFSPKVVRSASGSIGKIEIIKIDDVTELKDFNLITADLKGENILKFSWPEGFILCIGNEAGGVSEQVKSLSKHIVTIPISNSTESLNAAVACGIILYSASSV